MLPTHRTPTHPGEVLLEEFLRPLAITQVALASHLGVSVQRVNELTRGKRGVTPETAWMLAGAFGTTPEFWVNLQSAHDLVAARPAGPIVPFPRTTAISHRRPNAPRLVTTPRKRTAAKRLAAKKAATPRHRSHPS